MALRSGDLARTLSRAALAALAGSVSAAAQATAPHRTYANPIDIDYRYNFEQKNRGISFRSGADPVIGDRAYGSEPGKVAAIAAAIAEGLLAGGVLPVLKHLPGHGRATADSPACDASMISSTCSTMRLR